MSSDPSLAVGLSLGSVPTWDQVCGRGQQRWLCRTVKWSWGGDSLQRSFTPALCGDSEIPPSTAVLCCHIPYHYAPLLLHANFATARRYILVTIRPGRWPLIPWRIFEATSLHKVLRPWPVSGLSLATLRYAILFSDSQLLLTHGPFDVVRVTCWHSDNFIGELYSSDLLFMPHSTIHVRYTFNVSYVN